MNPSTFNMIMDGADQWTGSLDDLIADIELQEEVYAGLEQEEEFEE